MEPKEEHELDAPHPPPRAHRDSFRFICMLLVAVAVMAAVLYVLARGISAAL